MHQAYRPQMPRSYHVLLKIDHREFKGEGATRQQAKHNAAQKALKVLRNTPQRRTPSPTPPQNKAKPTTDTTKNTAPSATKLLPSSPPTTSSGKHNVVKLHKYQYHAPQYYKKKTNGR